MSVAALWRPIEFQNFLQIVRILLWGSGGRSHPRIKQGAWGSAAPQRKDWEAGAHQDQAGVWGAAAPQEASLKSLEFPTKAQSRIRFRVPRLKEASVRWGGPTRTTDPRGRRKPWFANCTWHSQYQNPIVHQASDTALQPQLRS